MHTYMATIAQTNPTFFEKKIVWLNIFASALHTAENLLSCNFFDLYLIDYNLLKSSFKSILVTFLSFMNSFWFFKV